MQEKSASKTFFTTTNKQNWQNIPQQFRQPLQNIFDILQISIKEIHKELKNTVTRNQLATALGSKLSISQLSTLYQHSNISSKNKHSNQQQMCQNQQNIKKIIDQQLKKMKNNIEEIKKQLNQNLQLRQHLEDKVCLMEKVRKKENQSFLETLQDKIDRSELSKLKKLHDLFLIEIKQIKERFDDNEKNMLDISKSLEKTQNQLKNKIQESYKKSQQIKTNIQCYVKQNIQNVEISINKTLDLVELRQVQIQIALKTIQNSKGISKSESAIHQSLHDCRKTILQMNKSQENYQNSINDLETRMNILELRQIHQTKSIKQNQLSRNNLQKLNKDFHALLQQFHKIQDQFRAKNQQSYKTEIKQMQRKIFKQIQERQQEVNKRISHILQEISNYKQNQPILISIKQKYKSLEQYSQKIMDRIIQNQRAIQKSFTKHQNSDNQIKESILAVMMQLKNRIKIDQLKKIVLNLVSADQVREIAIKLQQKFCDRIQKLVNDQKDINEALCSQNVLGKWLWTSGQIKCGNLVHWDHQLVNTLPQNFELKKQQCVIIVASKGLYRIQMGFYCKKKPSIQIIVNGKTVISAVNNSSYVIHHSSGKLKQVSNQGEIAGLSLIDFFLLPENSRIAISFSGQILGEGFISIHRI